MPHGQIQVSSFYNFKGGPVKTSGPVTNIKNKRQLNGRASAGKSSPERPTALRAAVISASNAPFM
jgi:hypothetical protein